MLSSDCRREVFERIEKTKVMFPKLTLPCENSLQSMLGMAKKLQDNFKIMWGPRELPPYQQFVSIYFSRNITYLRSAYLLGAGGLCGPSRDLQRTVFETLLRGYLFIVDNNEADLMYKYIGKKLTKQEIVHLQKRNLWPFNFLVKRLYTKETRKQHKQVFEELSRFSHPSIMSAFKDLDYSQSEVEDCLNIILCLVYGNIQMLSEGFFDFLDPSFKKTIKETLLEIADAQGIVALFEPNKKQWSSRIKLKNGNFMLALK